MFIFLLNINKNKSWPTIDFVVLLYLAVILLKHFCKMITKNCIRLFLLIKLNLIQHNEKNNLFHKNNEYIPYTFSDGEK